MNEFPAIKNQSYRFEITKTNDCHRLSSDHDNIFGKKLFNNFFFDRHLFGNVNSFYIIMFTTTLINVVNCFMSFDKNKVTDKTNHGHNFVPYLVTYHS